MEKIKQHKGIIIGIVLAIIIIAVAVVSVVIYTNSSDKEEDKKEKTSEKSSSKSSSSDFDYEDEVKEFVKACSSEKNMKKFIKNHLNLRAYYAMMESDDPSDFADEYEDADSEDYENEDFIDEVTLAFNMYVDDEEMTVTDIGKLRDIDKEDGIWGQTLSEVKGMKVVEFTIESDETEVKCFAYFYDKKMLIVETDWSNWYNPDDEDDDVEDELLKQEIELFNANFDMYEGSNQKGTDVKRLIDNVIFSNQINDENLVRVFVYFDEYDSTDLDSACFDRDAEKIEEELEKLKKEISASEKYKVEFDKDYEERITTVHIYEK